MSRIGRLPVVIPDGVTVEVKENNYVVVKGFQRNSRESAAHRDEHQS